MRQIFLNISSVAKYESKLLVRSWFFMIYIVIVVGLIVFAGMYLNNVASEVEHITSVIPYALVLVLNIIQSLIIIFMSSDYLKRDKQLDTSEVFYVRPLTNAEYLFGKVLGTLKPFLILDVLTMCVVYILARFGFDLNCSLLDFFTYLFIVIVPSLIFFVGISTALMLVIGNQAVTYIIMLGISWLSLFYTGSYVEYLFDMFMLSTPLAKSDVLGISNLGTILAARFIYVMLGVASMTLSVYLFKRLAGSRRLQRIYLVISIVLFSLSGLLIFNYTIGAYHPDRVAARLIALNDEYADYPRLEVADYDIDVEQQPHSIDVKMSLRGVMSKSGGELIFNLNGGMEVSRVVFADSSKELSFDRKEHLIVVDLGRTYDEDEELELSFEYAGAVDEAQMYIDIADKNLLFENKMYEILNFDKRVAYQEPEWVVLTPESGWYVRPGVTYSLANASWRQEYFSHYNLNVKPLSGMTPVSQGAPVMLADSVSYNFAPEQPLRAMSLMISRYKKYHTAVGGRDYALYIHESNKGHVEVFEPIADTISYIIDDVVGDFERDSEMEYSLPRLTIVDVPEQMYNYKRAWSSTQELGQPELMLLPGAGVSPMKYNGMYAYDVTAYYKLSLRSLQSRRGGQQTSDYDMRCNILRGVARQWNQVDIKTFSYSQSTGLSSSDNANPHYLSSILFNSKYNIVSDSLSWGNQLMELYYMSFDDVLKSDARSRSVVGMSDIEQVLQLLSESGCNRYLVDREYSKFVTEILMVQGNMLFGEAMSSMGVEAFTLTLKELIESREYRNVDMSEFLDSVSVRSGCDVRKNLELVNKPMELPHYQMGGLKTEKGYLYGEEIYISEVVIKNLSDVKGYVEVQFANNDGDVYTVVELEPQQIKRVVRHTTAIPQVSVNTMNSANIPQYISLGSAEVSSRMMPGSRSMGGGSGGMSMGGGMSGGGSGMSGGGGGMSGGSGGGGMSGGGSGMSGGSRGGMSIGGMSSRGGRGSMQTAASVTAEGDYVLRRYDMTTRGEIIVDNEDDGLFTLSEAPKSGYLNTWIDQSIDTKMLYKSPTMRTSYKWSLVSGQQFYGESILSAWQIRKGDGSQYAEWKIPVTEGERYAISFSTSVPTEVSRSKDPRRRQTANNANSQDYTYSFTIDNGDGVDDLKFDFSNMQASRDASIMWEWLGDYTAKQDTIVVRLNNKSDIERINADAVKAAIIKKN